MEHLQHFAEHLKKELSFKNFKQLPAYLDITLYRLNRLLKGNEDWYLEEIEKIAALLEVDPIDLIQKWGLGRKYITLQDMDRILAARGMELSFADQVA